MPAETTPATRSDEHVRDLAALLALPRMWRGHQPSFIGRSLVDVLVSLLRLDVASVKLSSDQTSETFEEVRPESAATALSEFDDTALLDSKPHVIATLAGSGEMRMSWVTAQQDSERAVVLVGSQRSNFPTELEGFLCRIAVEQALLAVYSSRLVTNLQVANASKATFLATMSHELRTPLNAVIGYSELLHAEIGGSLNETQQLHVKRIDTAARHLIALIEGILNFARIDAGKEMIHPTTVNVREATESVAVFLEPLTAEKKLELIVKLPDRAIMTYTDPAKLRQILLNLLSNGAKFTSHGYLKIEVRAEPNQVAWIVSDSGVGIAPEDLPLIFEPFRQVGQTHSERPPGTGLGLTVSRELARLLGGDVTVESTLGKGSTFTLRLPRAQARQEPAPAEPDRLEG